MKAKIYNYKNEDLTLKDICKISGVNASVIRSRLKKGWTMDKAADTPIGPNGGSGLSKGSVDRDYNKNRLKELKVFATCAGRRNS